MKITNRRAFYDYQILARIEAGISLSGPEVKAVRGGHVDLKGSFVRIIGSEAYLLNTKIYPYRFAAGEYDERRTRKLLLHKREIIALKTKTQRAGLTLVPLSLYIRGGFIKLEIGLGKGKRQFEKREVKRRRDIQRELTALDFPSKVG